MFAFSMSTSACIRDFSTAGVSPNVCIDWRRKTWRVGCVLRVSQSASHVSPIILKLKRRSKSTRPLFSLRAPAIARTSRLPSSGLLALQTTVSAQPVRENRIVKIITIKLGRALIASKDLSQYYGCSAYDLAGLQLDLETWPRIGARHADVIFLQGR
jgi:hypothetical protein